MNDYSPISLATQCNAGIPILESGRTAPIGSQHFRGLPFEIGTDPDRCFIAFGRKARAAPLSIPLECFARSVVIAHRLVDSRILVGGRVGEIVADYVFRYRDGSDVRVPIRERFEIGKPRTALQDGSWGHLPARAVPNEKPVLPPRFSGDYGTTPASGYGWRQREILEPLSDYYLWAWINPRPTDQLDTFEVVPLGPLFVLAALTVGHIDEHPLVPSGAQPVRIVITDPRAAARPFDLAVDVDRGSATFPFPLGHVGERAATSVAAPGWGAQLDPASSSAYVHIAALSSATVSVRHGSDVLGQTRWQDLVEGRAIDAGDVRLELTELGRNWVRTTVLDADTGRPVPCRIHFRSVQGIPYAPHGHHSQVNGNLNSWHVDVGGDVRLGQTTYAYIDGSCEGWLPRGEVFAEVARGFEYDPLLARVTIEPGQQELTLRLKRWRDLNAERWFSGDTHVHFLSTQGSHLEARGEDLNVVNLLQSQWGSLFTSTEEFTGQASVSRDGRTVVYASQENRQHFLGHLILLGLKRPVMPWCTDGAMEADLGGTLEATASDWADQCHTQGGTVIVPHFPSPNGEPAALVATGRADGVEMIEHLMYAHLEYYRYLNAGYRLALAGGTDKMSSEVPVGLYRTYVYVPPEEEFGYESWCRNLALGRTFVSSGPIISFRAEGRMVGDTVRLPADGGRVEVDAVAESIFPIHTLQIVQQGRVVAATEDAKGARQLRLRASLKVAGDTWLAARAGGPGYAQAVKHHDVWSRGVMAHTSPVYVSCGAQWQLFDREAATYMLTLIDATLGYIRELAPRYPSGAVTHHHGESDHQAYLERPFLAAQAAIEQRLREGGIA